MIPTAYPSFLRLRLLSLVIVLTLFLAACAPQPQTTPAHPPTIQPFATNSPAPLEASATPGARPSPVKPATATPPPAATITPQAEAGEITCLAFSPDGRWLAVGTSLGVHLYDGQTFALVLFIPTGQRVAQMAFSADGQTLATNHSNASQVQLWHVPDGAHLQTLDEYVSVLAFSPQGDLLATGGNGIKLWRANDGSLRQTLDTNGFVVDLAFSPDGNSLASAGQVARLWSIPDGAVLRDLPAHCGDLGCRKIFYASGGQMLVTLSSQSLIEGWDVHDGSRKYGQAVDVYADGVAVAPNGRFIATSSLELGLWQVADGAFAQGLQKYTFSEALLALAPNGNTLAASANGGVKVWDVSNGALQQALPGLFANGFAFSPDSAVLAVSSASKGEVRIVRVADGTELARLDGRGQSFPASAVAGQTAASAAGLPAVPSPDAHWSAAFRLAGLDGMVRAMASDAAGNLYAAGDFLTAGGAWVNHIARWDGSTWQPLGGGLESVDAMAVDATAADPQGKVYAAALLDGVRRVVCWDGAVWKVLPGTFDNHVSDLVTDPQGNLYAAGWFTAVDTLLVHHVARWDGAAWAALGDGLENMAMDIILSPQGHLFASSGFAAAGGPSAYHVYEWDGSTWTVLGEAFDAIIYSLALDDAGVLYAGGMFTSVGGAPAHGVARWDGAAWGALGSGLGGSQADGLASVETLAVDRQGRLLAGGYFTSADGTRANHLARWDGQSWQEWGGGTNGTVFAIQMTPLGASYIGGEFTQSGDTPTRYLARWTETAWQAVAAIQDAGAGLDGNVQALALDAQDRLYAGGEFLQAGGATVNHIARWDGTTWARLGNGLNGAVSSLALDRQGSLYASGEFTASGGQTLNHIARWDGAHWSALGKGLDGPARLTVSQDGSLAASWSVQDSAGKRTLHLARWDGTVWHVDQPGDREECNSYGCMMLVDPQGNLYSGGIEAPVAKWDGAAWVSLGQAMFSGALLMDEEDHLVATRQSAGPLFEGIFRWDGTAWQEIGNLLLNDTDGKEHSGSVSAVAAGREPGTIYVVASTDRELRSEEQSLFFWDGSTWRKLVVLGSSDESVSALALDSRGNLYLCGEFAALGGVPASHIAVWLAK